MYRHTAVRVLITCNIFYKVEQKQSLNFDFFVFLLFSVNLINSKVCYVVPVAPVISSLTSCHYIGFSPHWVAMSYL